MTLAMIFAIDRNLLIGKEGGMPWHVPGELKYFKSVTMGKPVIMGRKTFDSLGKPLPGRLNIVVTRNTALTIDGAKVVNDLDTAIDIAKSTVTRSDSSEQASEIMIVGGAQLYCDAMPRADRLYVTRIDAEFEGDTWLDCYEPAEWKVVSSEQQVLGGYRVEFQVAERAALPE